MLGSAFREKKKKVSEEVYPSWPRASIKRRVWPASNPIKEKGFERGKIWAEGWFPFRLKEKSRGLGKARVLFSVLSQLEDCLCFGCVCKLHFVAKIMERFVIMFWHLIKWKCSLNLGAWYFFPFEYDSSNISVFLCFFWDMHVWFTHFHRQYV